MVVMSTGVQVGTRRWQPSLRIMYLALSIDIQPELEKTIKQKLGQMLFSVELTQNRYCSHFLFNFNFEEGRNVVFVTLHLFPPLIFNDACIEREKRRSRNMLLSDFILVKSVPSVISFSMF